MHCTSATGFVWFIQGFIFNLTCQLVAWDYILFRLISLFLLFLHSCLPFLLKTMLLSTHEHISQVVNFLTGLRNRKREDKFHLADCSFRCHLMDLFCHPNPPPSPWNSMFKMPFKQNHFNCDWLINKFI